MITVLVTDSSKHPNVGARVSIFWASGGSSSETTGATGTATFKNLGTLNRITVYDKTVHEGEVYYDRDVTIPVTY